MTRQDALPDSPAASSRGSPTPTATRWRRLRAHAASQTPRLRAAGPWVVFAAAIAAVLGPALVGLRVVLPHDLLLAELPWSAAFAADPVNPELRDLLTRYYPVQHELVERLRAGEDLLWLPRVSLGMPGITYIGWGGLSPFLVPALFAPFDLAWSWSMALRLLVAMGGAYALTRSLGAGRAGATVAGVAFGLCGYMSGWLGWPQSHVGAFLPWVAWAARRCAGPRPAWWGVAAVALATLGLWLGGFPAVAVYGLLAAGLVACHAAWQRRDAGWPRAAGGLGAAALGVALGTGLAAATLLPSALFLDQLDLSHRVDLWRAEVAPPALVTFLVPGFFGDVVHQPWWLGHARLEQVGYAGATTLALALPAWLLRPRRPGVWFATALTAGLVALVYGVAPLQELVSLVPTLGMNPPTRGLALVGLWLAVLGGLGADAVIRWLRGTARVSRPAGIGLAGLAVAGAVAVARTRPDKALRRLASEAVEGGERLRAAYETAVTQTLLTAGLLAALVVVVAVGVLVARRSRPWAARVAGGGLVVLVAVDLVVFAAGWNVQVPREGLFPDAPAVSVWRDASARHRVAGTVDVGEPNSHLEYGLREMRGHANLTARHRAALRHMDAVFLSPTRWDLDVQSSAAWSPWVSAFGVSTVLTPDWVDVLPAASAARPGDVPLGELSGERSVTTTVHPAHGGTLTAVQLRAGDFGRDPVGELVVTVSAGGARTATGRRDLDELPNAKLAVVPVEDVRVRAGEAVTVEIGATTPADAPGVALFGTPRGDPGHPGAQVTATGPSLGLLFAGDRRFPVRDLGPVRAFRNPEALELVHAAPRARRAPAGEGGALAAVGQLRPEQLADVAVVEPRAEDVGGRGLLRVAGLVRADSSAPRRPGTPDAASELPDLPDGDRADVTAWSRSGGQVTAHVTSDEGAVVMLLEEAFDGWSATLDGGRAPVVRANALFVGVIVPPGEHTVGFAYRPVGLDAGLAATAAAGVALLAVTAVAWRRRGGAERVGAAPRVPDEADDGGHADDHEEHDQHDQ